MNATALKGPAIVVFRLVKWGNMSAPQCFEENLKWESIVSGMIFIVRFGPESIQYPFHRGAGYQKNF